MVYILTDRGPSLRIILVWVAKMFSSYIWIKAAGWSVKLIQVDQFYARADMIIWSPSWYEFMCTYVQEHSYNVMLHSNIFCPCNHSWLCVNSCWCKQWRVPLSWHACMCSPLIYYHKLSIIILCWKSKFKINVLTTYMWLRTCFTFWLLEAYIISIQYLIRTSC